MNQLRLKVCGLRDHSNILEVAALGPDYMGFIFYPGSKRFVGHDFIIPEELAAGIRRVGVFVDQPVAEILKVCRRNKLDLIQLHGNESADNCAQLRKSGYGVIKAFGIDRDFDVRTLAAYRQVADYFLFDTKGDHYGGHGIPFDWTLLRNYDQAIPFFLSGGISPENAGHTSSLSAMNLHAIDVNSRVERSIGIKDVELIVKLDWKSIEKQS